MTKQMTIGGAIILVALGIFYFMTFGIKPQDAGMVRELPQVDLYWENGEHQSLNEIIAGKPAIINSWASWCPFCVDELPDFITLQEEVGDEIVIVAINRGEEQKTAVEFLREINVTDELVFLYDPKDKWYQATGGYTMPETIFVNSAGDIVLHRRGFITLEEMRELVEWLKTATTAYHPSARSAMPAAVQGCLANGSCTIPDAPPSADA